MSNILNNLTGLNVGDIDLERIRSNIWVNANLNGTSDIAYGVSSLTDVATGRIGVNFSIAFPAADFVALCTTQAGNAVGTGTVATQDTANLSASRSDFSSNETSGSTNADPTEWNICIKAKGN